MPKSVLNVVLTKAGELNLVSKIKEGRLTISSTVKSTAEVATKMTFVIYEMTKGAIDGNLAIAFEADLRVNDIPNGGGLYAQVMSLWSNVIAPLGIIFLFVLVGSAGVSVSSLISIIMGILESIFKALSEPVLPKKDK